MGPAVKILPHYTYHDREQWKGNWELIEGIPYAMSPSPVPEHQRIAVNISAAFHSALSACRTCTVYQPIDYRITDDTILEPDLLIVCGEIKQKYLDFPPALVAEILSPSTALKDRHTKFYLYEQQAIRYYLIFDIEEKAVEIFELKDASYQLVQKGKNISYEFELEICKADIDFSGIW